MHRRAAGAVYAYPDDAPSPHVVILRIPGLYNIAYILDDMIVLAIAVITLRRFKLQERGGRRLKLLSGMVMLAWGWCSLRADG